MMARERCSVGVVGQQEWAFKSESQITQDKMRFEELDEVAESRVAGSTTKLCLDRGSLFQCFSTFRLVCDRFCFTKYLSSFIMHLAVDAHDSRSEILESSSSSGRVL
jgi:hypothetical protein